MCNILTITEFEYLLIVQFRLKIINIISPFYNQINSYCLKFIIILNYHQLNNQEISVQYIHKILHYLFNRLQNQSKSYHIKISNKNNTNQYTKQTLKFNQLKQIGSIKPNQLLNRLYQFPIQFPKIQYVFQNNLNKTKNHLNQSNFIQIFLQIKQRFKFLITPNLITNIQKINMQSLRLKIKKIIKIEKSEYRELNRLQQSLFSIIEITKFKDINFIKQENKDYQSYLLEQLYLQNEKFIRDYIQIRQEAQQLDMKVNSLSNQRKQLRIQ
ncbi:unnamed protein product [Paramecium sonneborni]|uniref:Uncharacterized protein n=1 Tax=Paramecium sonneborni TaxID=65129 RepID=A0A8S1QR91_9CILI|nr:unnamed protein product [Paramecium sonneborni]